MALAMTVSASWVSTLTSGWVLSSAWKVSRGIVMAPSSLSPPPPMGASLLTVLEAAMRSAISVALVR